MIKNKFYAALAAGTLALAAFTAVSGPAARADTPPCTGADDITCDPGPGWSKAEFAHGTHSWCMYTNGITLYRIQVYTCTPLYSPMRFFYRYINSGADIQIIHPGQDGYWHAIGFSGGYFKLQSNVGTWDLALWDSSGGAWTYSNPSPLGSYFMGDPGCSYCDTTSDIDPLSHWQTWALT